MRHVKILNTCRPPPGSGYTRWPCGCDCDCLFSLTGGGHFSLDDTLDVGTEAELDSGDVDITDGVADAIIALNWAKLV